MQLMIMKIILYHFDLHKTTGIPLQDAPVPSETLQPLPAEVFQGNLVESLDDTSDIVCSD